MAELRPRPRVFTIPSGAPFLATLAEALLSGNLLPLAAGDPLALAGLTVLLPTRRAVRAFREVLIARLGGEAAILPTIRPIGDIDEEDHLLDTAAEQTADRLVLPPTISRLNRRLALATLTLAWARTVRRELLELIPGEGLAIPASAADATYLAGDLARLLDDMETAGVPWDALARLVPEDQARYFQITLDFLKIVAERWPAYLEEIGRVDPAVRRDTLIRAAASELRRQPAGHPIVAAGSTGSIPATAALLTAIAGLSNGAVVLPGLDQGLDEAGWAAIDGADHDAASHGHPQYGLKQLIAAIGIARDEVEALAGDPAAARTRFVSEAMRPAETVDAWVRHAVPAADAFAGVDLIVARNEQEEATAIALAIREAVERPEATVALVTPDRTIARRVGVELGRWGLAIDDSAGVPLAGEPAGVFARLLAEVAVSDADPVKLLSLLKHPHAAFGMERAICRRAARMLEIALFRGHRRTGGITALGRELDKVRVRQATDAHVPLARRRLGVDDWQLAERLAGRLAEVLGPIESAFRDAATLSAAAASELLLSALAAAASDETGTDGFLWQGPGGEALATLLTGIIDDRQGGDLMITPAEYPFFLAALLEDAVVQRPAGADPRIHIWGTLEARLQSVDLLILGGLDEGVWPSVTRSDPWLSRSMRTAIGLPPPERRLGLAAHDFAEAMSAPRVIVTRAEKRGGAPTVESRWLQRLRALAGDEAEVMTDRGTRYVALARDIDWVNAESVRPVEAPRPRPPLAARPRQLPVTDIEILVRDPYAIYARRILRLEELELCRQDPRLCAARLAHPRRARRLHQILGRSVRRGRGSRVDRRRQGGAVGDR